MDREYSIVKCDLDGWNVVDATEVKDPRNGRIVGVTYRTLVEAERLLRNLREPFVPTAAQLNTLRAVDAGSTDAELRYTASVVRARMREEGR